MKKIFQISLLIILYIVLLIYLVPFFLVLLNSFKDFAEILKNPIALPQKINFSNYIKAFDKMKYHFAFLNSFSISLFSVIGIILFSSMTSYLFTRKKWKFNIAMFFIMVGSIYIPFQSIMIPLLKIYSKIHFLNSIWSLVYMFLGFGSNLAIFLYSGFIKGIPEELEESAMIDGASPYQIFFQIIFPLLIPTTVTIIILDVLWIWNDYLLPSLVLISAKNRTLPLSTFYFYGTYSADYNLLLAGLVMTIIPVIIIYLFLQKYIISGITQGALK